MNDRSNGDRTLPARTRRGCTYIAVALLVFASWQAAGAAWLHVKARVGQSLLLHAWSESRASGAPAKPWPWADTHPVARMMIPSRGIELLVLAGASGRTLAWGPGHLDGSARPGAPGNAIVTGHRDTHFAFLRDLAPGERIVVESASGARTTYRVEGHVIADHRALRLPADDDHPALSLVTCYPFDGTDPATPLRVAVIARAKTLLD